MERVKSFKNLFTIYRPRVIILIKYTARAVYLYKKETGMLKEYLKKRNISTYKLAMDIQEPYSTINDIVNGKKSIDECKFGLVKKIAAYLNISLDELSELGNTSCIIFSEQFHMEGVLYVKSKKYCLKFSYLEKSYDIELCKINENSTCFIKEIAKYELEKQISRMRMEAYLCNISL